MNVSDRLKDVEDKISQPNQLRSRMMEIQSNLNQMLEDRQEMNDSQSHEEVFKSLESSEKVRVLSILKEQQKGIKAMMGVIKQSAHKIKMLNQISGEIKKQKISTIDQANSGYFGFK